MLGEACARQCTQIFKILYDFGTTLAGEMASDEMESEIMQTMTVNHTLGQALCPICTHTVPAEIDTRGKTRNARARVTPGQRCPRCAAPLDVAVVIEMPQAA